MPSLVLCLLNLVIILQRTSSVPPSNFDCLLDRYVASFAMKSRVRSISHHWPQLWSCGGETCLSTSVGHRAFIRNNPGLKFYCWSQIRLLNPGPTKFPCGVCSRPAKSNQRAVCCDSCDIWFHVRCMNMSSSTYEGLNNSYTSWFCSNCDSSNFSTSLFESTSVVSTNNSFNLPVAENTSTTTQCDFTPFVASSPKETPTQSYRNTPGRKQSGFKVLNVNFQSVRNKAAELAALISKHKLDVIIGTETHLSPEINSSEIFSDNFCVHRRDRDCHGGGTVIAIRDNLNSIRRSDLETDCEIIWVEILSPNNKSALVGSFYRPPSSFLAVIMSLEESLIKAFSAASNHLLILGGDFILPGVNWTTRSVKPSARDPHLCHRLLDVTNDLHLSQMVMEPTRRSDTTANNLDLLLVSKPDLVVSMSQTDWVTKMQF